MTERELQKKFLFWTPSSGTTDLHPGHNWATSTGHFWFYQHGYEANMQTSGANNLSLLPSLLNSFNIHSCLSHTYLYLHSYKLVASRPHSHLSCPPPCLSLLPSNHFHLVSFQSQYPCLLPGCWLWSMLPLSALLTMIRITSCISSTVSYSTKLVHILRLSFVLFASLIFLSFLTLSAPDLPKPQCTS